MDVSEPGAKEILLTEMAQFSANLLRDRRVIIYHETNSGGTGYGQNLFGDASDFFGRGLLGTKLNQIGTTLTKLLGNVLR